MFCFVVVVGLLCLFVLSVCLFMFICFFSGVLKCVFGVQVGLTSIVGST